MESWFPSEGIADQMRNRLLAKKRQLDQLRPFPTSALQRLKEDFAIEWTYNSNSIEGNTLSLRETRVVLQDGLTIGGKSLREHFETHNHHKAIAWLEELVKPNHKLLSKDILHLHALVMQSIDDEFKGRYRNGRVRITGANFIPPNPLKIAELIDELVQWVNQNPQNLDPIGLAAVFHHRFVWIHPFFDGNGRTARLAMNIILLSKGYPPAIILKVDRAKYYESLNLANAGKWDKLMLLMAQAAERSLDIYLTSLGGNNEDFLPLSELAKEPRMPYGQEYLSLMARQGKIEAFKEGRVWYSSKEAVQRYLKK